MVSSIGNSPALQTPVPPVSRDRDGDGDGGKDGVRGAGARAGGTTEKLTAASVSESTSTDLKIVTQQGDVVTLHASLDTNATYASLRSRGPNGKIDAKSLSLSSQQSLSVSVQGDLNAQEQADIDQLVKRIGSDLKSFLSGQGGATGHEADGLSSLAGFQVQFSHSETATAVSIVRRLPAAPAGTDASGAKPLPTPVPVSPAPEGDTATTPAVTGAAAPPVTLTANDVHDLVQKLLKSGDDEAKGASPFAHLANAVRKAIDHVAKDPAFSAQGGLFDQLRSALDALSASSALSVKSAPVAAPATPTDPAPTPDQSPANPAAAGN
jgi:chitodextrinase